MFGSKFLGGNVWGANSFEYFFFRGGGGKGGGRLNG